MQIPYDIVRSSRKTIAIQIKHDGSVVVRCPRQMRSCDVQMYVESKKLWIESRLARLKPILTIPLTAEEVENLRKRARKLVEERVAYYAPIAGVNYNRIAIRMQRTRWGSCSSRGNLNFNCLLALVPPEVLDYVVVHELCHLKELNHCEMFWVEVERILPDYRQSKNWLRINGRELIARIPNYSLAV